MTVPMITSQQATEYLDCTDATTLMALFLAATQCRTDTFEDQIETCAIVNAKCGECTENCNFCPQSIFSKSEIEKHPLFSVEKILDAAKEAEQLGATRFGIVTSGRTIKDPTEMKILCDAVRKIKSETRISPCASLGILTYQQLVQLKEAGLERYHHNLETSRSYYPSICTTRTYDDQVRTVKDAQQAGLSVCSGGLFGLGETNAQRVELFETLRELQVDSVPINFLSPIPGTAHENRHDLTPLLCLKIITIARLMLPKQRIRICGGREQNLRELQSMIFAAGADSMMVGNYLVTHGRTIEKDRQIIEDLNLKVIQNETHK